MVINLTKNKIKFKTILYGAAVGLVNGVFGAGGGMLAVPILKANGLDQKQSHANAVAVILPITLMSAMLYLVKGSVSFADSLPYIPTGLLGSIAATFLLQKFSNNVLQKLFAAFMIYAGIRLLAR